MSDAVCSWCGKDFLAGEEPEDHDGSPVHFECYLQASDAEDLRWRIAEAVLEMREALEENPKAMGCRLGDDCRALVDQVVKIAREKFIVQPRQRRKEEKTCAA